MIGVKISEKARDEWMKMLRKVSIDTMNTTHPLSYKKTFPWKIQAKLSIHRGTSRESSSAIYQLKLGHGYFQSYLQRMGITEDDTCTCGTPETPSHLLLRCTDLKEARTVMRETLKCDLTPHLLLHTTKGIEATINFIKTTRISTRSRQEERTRMREEEEEEYMNSLQGGITSLQPISFVTIPRQNLQHPNPPSIILGKTVI